MKFLKKLLKIVGIVFACLIVISIIAYNTQKKDTEQKSTNDEKIELSSSQKEIVDYHLKVYEKLSETATSGDDLEVASQKANELTCEKFKITERELEQIFDIYNFGYILEPDK